MHDSPGISRLTGRACSLQRVAPYEMTLYDDESIGDYAIKDGVVAGMTDDIRARLASVIGTRKLRGEPPVAITSTSRPDWIFFNKYHAATVDELLELYPKSAQEMIDGALLNTVAGLEHPTNRVSFPTEDLWKVYATSEASRTVMVGFLLEAGFLRETLSEISFIVTPKGWERVRELKQPQRKDTKSVFVAMAFHRTTEAIFHEGIIPAITTFGLRPERVDKVEHNHKICDTIIALIRQAKFVVADFTRHRGGVYFEAGFARGLQIPVIWTCHEKHSRRLHFDTRQYNHIIYQTPEELTYRLRFRIKATIPDLPLSPDLEIDEKFEKDAGTSPPPAGAA